MWANAQRDGRPAEYRWRPLLNATVWLMPTTRVPCSNAAKPWNPLKLAGVPQTNETISAASGPKFTILWGQVEEILLLRDWQSTPLEWLSSIRDLELDIGSGHTAYRHASLTELYLHIKFHWNQRKKTFCGRTIRRYLSKFKVTWHKI